MLSHCRSRRARIMPRLLRLLLAAADWRDRELPVAGCGAANVASSSSSDRARRLPFCLKRELTCEADGMVREHFPK